MKWVVNYPYQITGAGETNIHLSLFHDDFRPAVGSEITVNGNPVGKCDATGTCIFRFRPGSGSQHTLAAGGTILMGFACNARTESFRSDHLFVYTDRGVYNPGTRVLIRLLAWELLGEYSALAERTVEIFLEREGRLYFGMEAITDARGVGYTEIPLAESLPEGTYDLKVCYAGQTESARLQVRRFQPPAVEIEHTLPRFLTPRQERLDFEVKLRYPTGGEPAESVVKLILTGQGGKVLRSHEWTGESAYQLSLEDLQLELNDGDPLQFQLEAQDSFGQRGEMIRDAKFSNRPYTAALETDKDAYPAGEEVELKVKLVDLDGRPAANVGLECRDLREATDSLGVANFRFEMPAETVEVTVTVPELGIEVGSRSIQRVETKAMLSKVLEDPRGGKVRLRATFESGYVPVESVVHVDFTDLSGALVTSSVIPIKDGVAEGEVHTDSWGTMLVNLYCLAARADSAPPWNQEKVGFVTEGQNVTVYPDRELQLELRGFSGNARPGTLVNFEVVAARPAALGAALVDRSVLSLMDPLEKSPLEHFYQAQRKAISTGGSAVMTWPRVDRSWGTERQDIAYCNWGFKQPEPPGRLPPEGGGGAAQSMDLDLDLDLDLELELDYGPPDAFAAPAEESCAEPTMIACDFAPSPAPCMAPSVGAAMGAPPPPPPRGGPTPWPAPQITVRTQQPDTAWWEPALQVGDGPLSLEMPVPDLVGSQRLTLVASDEHGRVGVLRQDLAVTQELWSRLTVPGRAVAGDLLEVQALIGNGTDSELQVEVSADGGTALALQLPPLGTELAVFLLECPRPGEQKFRVDSKSNDFHDVCYSKTRVAPAGFPLETTVDGPRAEVLVRAGASHSTLVASLTLNQPVMAALQGWDLCREFPWPLLGPSGFAGRLLLEVALLEWCLAQGFSRKVINDCKRRIAGITAELVAVQQPDGSWGTPLVTTRVLEALLEGRRVGLKWTGERMEIAGRYLLTAAVPEAPYWPRVFAVVAQLGQATGDWNRAAGEQLSNCTEPLALAMLMRGLNEVNVRRLLNLRKQNYWEPQWDSAYGGMVEVNALLLEMLIGHDAFELEVREIVQYLLSTRAAWGRWHNEMGTLAAVRALLKVAPSQSAWSEGEVVLRVNGQEAVRTTLEGDPLVAAARLRHVDVTQYLQDGLNWLEVEGADLSATLRQWGLGSPPQELTLARCCASQARLGELLEVRLHLATPRALSWSRVEDALPAHVAPDLPWLEGLVRRGEIQGYALTPGGLALELGAWEGQRELVYRVRTVLTGRSGHSGCRLMGDEDSVGYAVSQPLEVYPAMMNGTR